MERRAENAVSRMPSGLTHERERVRRFFDQLVRNETVINRGQPVNILHAGLGKEVRMVARVVEDDEIERFFLRITQEGLHRLLHVVGITHD